MDQSLTSSPVFSDDKLINLYHLNGLYGNLAKEVSRKLNESLAIDVPITSGIWGGTYLIADKTGLAKRRIWRLYCIINLPQNTPLDKKSNLDHLIAIYSQEFASAFKEYGLELDLKMWGGTLPYSCKSKPSFTMHMEDATETVRWLRAFFVWNQATWEESVIYDLVRIIKEYKEYFDLKKGPVQKEAQEIKYLLQDIIIIYRTLEKACDPDFIEHAEPIIEDLMQNFIKGLHDEKLIQELYLKVFESALIYGYEQALEGPYSKQGLNIHNIENWPVEKINLVPEELKASLIPPIQNLFSGFKENLATPGGNRS
jgi:hypothetical protein